MERFAEQRRERHSGATVAAVDEDNVAGEDEEVLGDFDAIKGTAEDAGAEVTEA